jgi:superfamily II RNA helicase
VLDEGHYFNEPQRGYVWEQTIIGLHPDSQLVILSATVGHADQFCHWVELTRRTPFKLVESRARTVPLEHEYREAYLIEVVRELQASGDTPAIIFTFGRERCFENARLLKSCRRFTTDEERARIEELAADVLGDGRRLATPLAWFPRLLNEQRAHFELLGEGVGIHWPDVDEDLSVESLLAGRASGESQDSLRRWLKGRRQAS